MKYKNSVNSAIPRKLLNCLEISVVNIQTPTQPTPLSGKKTWKAASPFFNSLQPYHYSFPLPLRSLLRFKKMYRVRYKIQFHFLFRGKEFKIKKKVSCGYVRQARRLLLLKWRRRRRRRAGRRKTRLIFYSLPYYASCMYSLRCILPNELWLYSFLSARILP